MELYEKLVCLRKEKGVSQIELAEALDVSRQAISKWEVGSAVPSAKSLRGLSNFYNVSLDYLIGNTDIETTQEECKASENAAETGDAVDRKHFNRCKLTKFLLIVVCVWSIVLVWGIFRQAVLAAWLFIVATGVLLTVGLMIYISAINFWRNRSA